MTRLVNLPALLILGVCSFPQAAQAQVHFESDVQPLLEKHCLSCHSAEESNGGLNFEGLSTVFQEADSGKHAIVPGKPAESELLSRVVSNDEDVRMPPDGPRLSEDEIGLLRDWIELGANIPQEWMDTADTQVCQIIGPFNQFFAHRYLKSRSRLGVVLRLITLLPLSFESQELNSAEDASPEVLIRRACYDLTGLPPSMERVRHFQSRVAVLGDPQLAFAELVDELLAQSEYGERWGRHWMDWVRYADTAGCNSDFPIPQAYLYRNYIIDSLNEDMPYDRFLTEQLAGDLLPAESQTERNRLNIATGYLAMARRFGSLVETYPWHLTIEDTIDNMGRTMLGMTLACARCHDHKFDPVSTRDYYGLYGIFASTKYAFPGIELFQVQHEMVPLVSEQELEHLLGEEAPKTEKLVDKLRAELEKCRKRELENAARESSLTLAEKRQQYDELQSMLGKARNAGSALAKHLKELPAVPVAYAVQDGQPQAARIHIKGESTRLGAEVPRGFPKVLGGYRLQETSTSGRLELAQWITHQDNPLTARVIVNRVWQRHFGRGLVASTSDFGIRGELPSHPALLDWLADDFKKHGWSLKHLHRRILNSRTYQRSSRSHDSVQV